MSKIMIFYLLCLCLVQVRYAVKVEILYWERKPYIWEENGQMRGIFPEVLYKSQRYCDPTNDDFSTYKHKFNSASEFKKAMESDVVIGEGFLKNITKQEYIAWVPSLIEIGKLDHQNLVKKGLTQHALTSGKSISVITPRKQIELSYKLYIGIMDTAVISSIALMLSVVSGALMWVIERKSAPFKDEVYNGLWWSQVTMTTTGYGDIVPLTMLGKFVGGIWMFCGIMVGSVITATVSDSVNGIKHLSIAGKKVAVVTDTYEAFLATRDFSAKAVHYETYDQVYESVKNGDTFAGMVNTAVLSWELDKLADNTDRNNPLALIHNIDVDFPIDALGQIYGQLGGVEFLICAFKTYRNEIIDATEKYYKKHIETETIYIGSLQETLMSDSFYLALTCIAAIIIILIFVYEMLRFIRKQTTKTALRRTSTQVTRIDVDENRMDKLEIFKQ